MNLILNLIVEKNCRKRRINTYTDPTNKEFRGKNIDNNSKYFNNFRVLIVILKNSKVRI